MYPVDPSVLVGQAQQAAGKGLGAVRGGVDLTKKYVRGLDVAYSSLMGRRPAVPRFEQKLETDDD